MDDLRDLYQTVILDHNKAPRNYGTLEDADRKADGHNPLCGDKLTVYLKLDEDENVTDVRFEGLGCAISRASASLMTECVKGRPKRAALEIFERFHEMVTGNPTESVDASDLGKLSIFSGVREYPARVKCATLAWHTFQAALESSDGVTSTE